jgi:hypothetical protein
VSGVLKVPEAWGVASAWLATNERPAELALRAMSGTGTKPTVRLGVTNLLLTQNAHVPDIGWPLTI